MLQHFSGIPLQIVPPRVARELSADTFNTFCNCVFGADILQPLHPDVGNLQNDPGGLSIRPVRKQFSNRSRSKPGWVGDSCRGHVGLVFDICLSEPATHTKNFGRFSYPKPANPRIKNNPRLHHSTGHSLPPGENCLNHLFVEHNRAFFHFVPFSARRGDRAVWYFLKRDIVFRGFRERLSVNRASPATALGLATIPATEHFHIGNDNDRLLDLYAVPLVFLIIELAFHI